MSKREWKVIRPTEGYAETYWLAEDNWWRGAVFRLVGETRWGVETVKGEARGMLFDSLEDAQAYVTALVRLEEG